MYALRMCTWSSGWTDFLCYLYELFTLFLWIVYAIGVVIYSLRYMREVSCWTGSLTNAHGEVDLVHGRWTHLGV
jgi:hypothetical protein